MRITTDARARLVAETESLKLWNFYASVPGKQPLFPRKAGQFMICAQVIDGLHVWVVANIWVVWPLQNRGIMRKFIRLVRSRYPNLCSDLSGTTSADAIRMWQALGAERLETKRCPKGHIYLLR